MATDNGGNFSSAVRDRGPGWYPDISNPNLQRHWDGTRWSAQRLWARGQWQESRVSVDALGEPMPSRKRSFRKSLVVVTLLLALAGAGIGIGLGMSSGTASQASTKTTTIPSVVTTPSVATPPAAGNHP